MRLIDADALKENCVSCFSEWCEWCSKGNGHCEICSSAIVTREMIDNAPTIPIQRDVWELYQRHQSHLGTYVYEFGIELKELLCRYEEGGRQ